MYAKDQLSLSKNNIWVAHSKLHVASPQDCYLPDFLHIVEWEVKYYCYGNRKQSRVTEVWAAYLFLFFSSATLGTWKSLHNSPHAGRNLRIWVIDHRFSKRKVGLGRADKRTKIYQVPSMCLELCYITRQWWWLRTSS